MKPISFTLAGMALLAVAVVGVAQESDRAQAGRSTDGPAAKQPEAIDFERARQLFQKRQRGGMLTADEQAYLQRAMAARGNRPGGGAAPVARDSTGLKPLCDMTARDRYQGEDGGLYGGGANEPPAAHRQAAEAALRRIQPLDRNGRPAAEGRVVFVSISMSNATQEFSTFKRIADGDPRKAPELTIVDCAQGGQAMAEWAPADARPWSIAEQTLDNHRVTPRQVQIAWIKLANKGPHGDLAEHGRKLQRDTLAVVRNAKTRFPNLQVAYLASRIYGGYAGSNLNPEPYAYESAFAARWLIQDQMRGEKGLNYDPSKGPVEAPVLLWGPYLWADGVKPRASDQLVWLRDDLGGDGTHPSPSGREKVARLLLEFFAGDPLAKTWFAP